MDRGQQEFLRIVVNPALAKARGLPRLKSLFIGWIDWTESADLPGGCPMIGGAIEFDDKPARCAMRSSPASAPGSAR
jgi:hypothetical protein